MEKGPCAHRKTDVVPLGEQEFERAEREMLENKKMPNVDPTELSGMGISNRDSLLVHKWHDLSWRGSGELAGEDENVPAM